MSPGCHNFKLEISHGIIFLVKIIAVLSKKTFKLGTLLKSILLSGLQLVSGYNIVLLFISVSTKFFRSIQAFLRALQITSVQTHSFSGGYHQT
jgi:hypothetical protein